MKTLQLSLNVFGFLLLGAFALAYLFVTLGELNIRGNWEYLVYADFANASGLTPGYPNAHMIPGRKIASDCGHCLVKAS